MFCHSHRDICRSDPSLSTQAVLREATLMPQAKQFEHLHPSDDYMMRIFNMWQVFFVFHDKCCLKEDPTQTFWHCLSVESYILMSKTDNQINICG